MDGSVGVLGDGVQRGPVGLCCLVDTLVSGIPLLDIGFLLIWFRPVCTERTNGFLALSLTADLRGSVLVNHHFEARVNGDLGRLHLGLLERPFLDVFSLMCALEAERPALDLWEVSLEETVVRFCHLYLNLVDRLGGNVSLFRSFLGRSEFAARLYANGCGRNPEGVTDGFEEIVLVLHRALHEGGLDAGDLLDAYLTGPLSRHRCGDPHVRYGILLLLFLMHPELTDETFLGKALGDEDVLGRLGLVKDVLLVDVDELHPVYLCLDREELRRPIVPRADRIEIRVKDIVLGPRGLRLLGDVLD